jgi:hypothetical protein
VFAVAPPRGAVDPVYRQNQIRETAVSVMNDKFDVREHGMWPWQTRIGTPTPRAGGPLVLFRAPSFPMGDG